MKKKNNNLGKKIAVGAGVVAVGTAAYMLLGPNGKKNRAKVQAFAKGVGKKVSDNKDVQRVTDDVKHMFGIQKKAVKKAAKKVAKKVTTKVAEVKKVAKKKLK
jgi:hypothetical protein